MKKVILKVGGMSCSACQNHVEKYLNKQEGVKASVNLVLAQALIEYDETKLTVEDLERFIKESGYESLGLYDQTLENKKDYNKEILMILGGLIVLIMYITMGHMLNLPTISFLDKHKYPLNYGIALLVLILPFLFYGLDIIKKGLKNLIHLRPNMDSLVTIGIIASGLYSIYNLILIFFGNYSLVDNLYLESIAMIIYFVKLGRHIDNLAKEKTKEALKELVQITPQKALLKVDKGEKEVTIDEVKKGDILICKPGIKIAVDGVITKGETHINEAFITGESKQEKKKAKDKVIAGSINIDGYIEYKALNIGKDSTISQIVRLVMEAANTKAPIQRLADKVSSIFVPSIIVIAVLTLIGYLLFNFSLNEALTSFVTVLVVACPCALGLATPLAIVVSEGMAAKRGILIRSSDILERAKDVDTVVFDKTGTLTYGNLRIAIMFIFSMTEDEILEIVGSLENKSTHPIAKAFKTYIQEHKLKLAKITNFKEMSGIGLSGKYNGKEVYVGNAKIFKMLNIKNKYAEKARGIASGGNSVVYVVIDKELVALIGINDVVRYNAEWTIRELKYYMDKDVEMLTGDNLETAQNIADNLGIMKVKANCLPQDKKSHLDALRKNGHVVMMVGDGINDAPSLASSDIGVSFNSGTDVAADSADVILMNDDISRIVDLINISKKTDKIIKENLFWAFFYNILMIPIAIGFLKPFNISLSPMLAALAMVISSLTVTLNSLRLKRFK